MSCYDYEDHQRQARDDFHRGGRYGYDREEYDRYADHDSCSRYYTEEFDRTVREEDRRQEEREREEAEERVVYRRAQEERELEEMYLEQAYQEAESYRPEPLEPSPPAEGRGSEESKP